VIYRILFDEYINFKGMQEMNVYPFPNKKQKKISKQETVGIPRGKNKIIFDPKKYFRLQDFKRRLKDIWR